MPDIDTRLARIAAQSHRDRAWAEAWLAERRYARSRLALRRAKRRTALTVVIWCLAIFAFTMLCAWGGGLL